MPARQRSTAIGLAISGLRHERGWTQEELGHRGKMHRTYVGAVEQGKKDLGLAKLLQFAQALMVEPEDLLGEARKYGLIAEPPDHDAVA